MRHLERTIRVLIASAFAIGSISCSSSDDASGNGNDGGSSSDGDAIVTNDGATDTPPADATSSDVAGETPHPGDVIDPSRVTTWNPGILSDEQLHLPLGADGIPTRTMICASPKPGDDLQAAIDGCSEGQVVELDAASYSVGATITLKKGVVLRGAGSAGAGKGGTTI